jgi:hypothetical protein
LLVVSTSPCCAVPDTVGTPVFEGADAAAVIVAVCAELAEVEPPAFVAVTTERTVSPTSAACNVYVVDVAPLMFEQLEEDVQRCHW